MDETGLKLDRLDTIVRRVFSIEDTTNGSNKDGYLVRYHGRLLIDSVEAYDRIAEQLRPQGITPLFRVENGRQTVILMDGVQNPKPANPRVNLIFFILTVLSVLFTGGIMSMTSMPSGFLAIVWAIISLGWPFTVSMLGILLAHEFGHYLAGRYHKTMVSLPYLLPLPYPISPFGTLGAFINMKEVPRNRRILMDIAIAGPLAGLVVAIPVLLYGLSISTVSVLPAGAAASGLGPLQMEGNSILYLAAKWLVFGKLLPAPLSYGGLAPALYWIRYFFTGLPLPYGGLDVNISPVAWAGWGGLLITSLNLIPAGQLDGGHLFYTLFGVKNARRALLVILVALVALGFLWPGWWLWAVLVLLFGRVYAEPLDQITQLDGKRKVLAAVALVLFLLLFTPIPLSLM